MPNTLDFMDFKVNRIKSFSHLIPWHRGVAWKLVGLTQLFPFFPLPERGLGSNT